MENKLKKLKIFDLTYFIGKSYFDEDGNQNYLIFHSILNYFTLNNKWITKWKSKALSNESLEIISTSDNSLTSSVNYYREKVRLKFAGSVLQQKTITCNHKKVVNLYIVYRIAGFHSTSNDRRLANALFGADKLTKKMLTLININILDME